MLLSRRTLLALSAAGTASLVARGRFARAAADATVDIREDALYHFAGRGFAALPPLDLITGHAFNGGLRYDDTRRDHAEHRWVTLQPVARMEDIAARNRPGVLAGFTIIGLQSESRAKPGTLFAAVMEFLINRRRLDPGKMVFVSTALFRPQIERDDGVSAERFIERPVDEARAAGDGSGFFAPAGHPDRPAFVSASIHYPIDLGDPPGRLSYPLEGYVEIAEVGIGPTGEVPGNPESAGIGLERLAMAEGQSIPSYDDFLPVLLSVIEDEASSKRKPLPPGHAKLAAL